MTIIWRWKADIMLYVGRPGIVDVKFVPFHKDPAIFGRDGWVGFIKGDERSEKTEWEVQAERRKTWTRLQ